MHRRDVIRRAEIARVRSRAQPWRRQLSKTKTHRSPPLARFRFGGKSLLFFSQAFCASRARLHCSLRWHVRLKGPRLKEIPKQSSLQKEWMHHKKHSVDKTVRHEQCGQQLAGGQNCSDCKSTGCSDSLQTTHELILEIQQKFVPLWVDGDEVLARRFEGGLRPQIKALVIPFELKAYRDIARKASLVKKCLLEVERDRNDLQKKRHAIEVPQQEQDSYNPKGRDSKCLRL
ncbi:hypothetical protein NL676_015640 [Syzygium grande]|nr:hypothetical protein NL676_015640 [Syzygium grande]